MKKIKKLFTLAAIGAAVIGFYVTLRFIKNKIDNYPEEGLFDDDLDFIDDDFAEEPEGPIKDDKTPKGSKVRRGYVPIKFHTKEAASEVTSEG